jgi:hypothetical protein
MLESSFPNLGIVNRLPDLLVVQLRGFTASLIEQGYAGETVRLLACKVSIPRVLACSVRLASISMP